jgi:hypothetical protein
MINRGQTLDVYGRGFCPTPRCSRVIVKVGRSRAASGVRVHANGRFVVGFVFSFDAGHYIIKAVQAAANRSQLVATTPITVGLGDMGGAAATTLAGKRVTPASSATQATTRPATTEVRVPQKPQDPLNVGGGARPVNGGTPLASRESGSSGWSLGAIIAVAAGGVLLLLGLALGVRRGARRASA